MLVTIYLYFLRRHVGFFLNFKARGNKIIKLYWKYDIDFKKLIPVFPVTMICECVTEFYRSYHMEMFYTEILGNII